MPKQVVRRVPQNLEEAATREARVARLLKNHLADLNREADRIRKIKAEGKERRGENWAELIAECEDLAAFSDAHRDELTADTKSYEVGGGQNGWRFNPAHFEFKDSEALLAYLLEHGPEDFIRHPPAEINVEAMEADTEEALKLEGVEQVQEEVFYVRPLGTGSPSLVREDRKWRVVVPKKGEE